ncbi:hypothetical protein [Acetivibrio ethanolgignens]|uniref:Peptidase S54 rhomboid domain-containing protein n=1 Tax=Acetivibrio ethanolgignens TaxID=290052 RepID=A0A0V8QGJ4_9FIRM|nr:hypothetical protein [Acetivibrio ethanolgignens]KSV59546.1 hypothetical protein ASU35_08540 [Acetivibrio ethanolgignens]
MKFLDKLERKYGRYAIQGLMRYVVVLSVAGTVIGLLNPYFYGQWLCLDFDKIFQGQIWRLFTYILQPGLSAGIGFVNPISMLLYCLELYFYYWIGSSLENVWGSFRFNMYYMSGFLLNIVAAAIIYFAFGVSYPAGLGYINQTMFLAVAVLFPNVQVLFMFFIPLKIKWLGYLYGALLAYNIIACLISGAYPMAIALIVATGNFLMFFFSSRNYRRMSPKQVKRRAAYKREVHQAKGITRHKCAVCGRTELDDENLEFRFCSKCDGNYEYCMEHLFTHEHVHKH